MQHFFRPWTISNVRARGLLAWVGPRLAPRLAPRLGPRLASRIKSQPVLSEFTLEFTRDELFDLVASRS